MLRDLARGRHHRDQAPPGAPARRDRPADLRPHAPPADDPAGRDRGLSVTDWPDVLVEHAASEPTAAAADRAAARLRGSGARVLPAARALGARRGAARDRRRPRGGAPARRRPRRDRARGARGAARPLPARARGGQGRGPLVVRRARRGRARRVAAVLDARRRPRVAGPRRRRPTSSWPCSSARSQGSRTPRGSTPRPTARRSGQASSTCGTPCSARRSTTSARSRPSELAATGRPCHGRRGRHRARRSAGRSRSVARGSSPPTSRARPIPVELRRPGESELIDDGAVAHSSARRSSGRRASPVGTDAIRRTACGARLATRAVRDVASR